MCWGTGWALVGDLGATYKLQRPICHELLRHGTGHLHADYSDCKLFLQLSLYFISSV